MSDPIPIKPGVEPVFDTERELVDFFITKMRGFNERHGQLPSAIALVFLAEDEIAVKTGAYSWSLDDKKTRLQTCSVAATLLQRRAVDSMGDVS